VSSLDPADLLLPVLHPAFNLTLRVPRARHVRRGGLPLRHAGHHRDGAAAHREGGRGARAGGACWTASRRICGVPVTTTTSGLVQRQPSPKLQLRHERTYPKLNIKAMSRTMPVASEDQQLQLNSPCWRTIKGEDGGAWSVPRKASSWILRRCRT
jgi:hypothetical protein